MTQIVIEFEQEDNEMQNALERFFPNSYETHEHKGLDGGLELFIAIITIIDVTLHCVEFFISYFANASSKKRAIVTPKGKISFEGFSEEEVSAVLKDILK